MTYSEKVVTTVMLCCLTYAVGFGALHYWQLMPNTMLDIFLDEFLPVVVALLFAAYLYDSRQIRRKKDIPVRQETDDVETPET